MKHVKTLSTLAAAMLISACGGQAPAVVPTDLGVAPAAAPAEVSLAMPGRTNGVTMTAQLGLPGQALRGLLNNKPTVTEPYTAASIHHVVVALHEVPAANEDLGKPLMFTELTQANLTAKLIFKNLSYNTKYLVRVYAYADEAENEPIDTVKAGDAEACTTYFETTFADLVDVKAIKLKLRDRGFAARTGGGRLAITPGGLNVEGKVEIEVDLTLPEAYAALKVAQDALDAATPELDEKEAAVDDATTAHTSAQTAATSAQDAVTAQEVDVASLQSQLTEAQSLLDADPGDSAKDLAVQNLKAQLNTAQATLAGLNTTLTEANDALSAATAAKEAAEAELATVQATWTPLKQARDEAQEVVDGILFPKKP